MSASMNLRPSEQEALSAVAEAYQVEIFDPGDGGDDDDVDSDFEDPDNEGD